MRKPRRRGWLFLSLNLAITLALLTGIIVSVGSAGATEGTAGHEGPTKYTVTSAYLGSGVWTYTVSVDEQEGDPQQGISHLIIAICLGPNDGITWEPEYTSSGYDPSTGFPADGSGLTGYKWEGDDLSGGIGTYKLTAEGYDNDPAGAEAVVKAGNNHEHFAQLNGPDCTPEEPTPTPEEPTPTPEPPTPTPEPPTPTPEPPTPTPEPPTPTPEPPTPTPEPPTPTPEPPTPTPEPPTPTPTQEEPGTIVVEKVVINDDGGDKNPEDFTINIYRIVDGSPVFVTSGTFDATTKQVTFDVDPGEYLLEEDAETLGDYIASFDPPCEEGAVTVEPGETANCTVNNDDPEITVEEPTPTPTEEPVPPTPTPTEEPPTPTPTPIDEVEGIEGTPTPSPTPIDEVEGISQGPVKLPETGGGPAQPVQLPWMLLTAFGASLVSLAFLVRRHFYSS